jgi:MFS family permease
MTYSAQYCFGVFFKPILSEFGWTRAITSGAFSLSMMISGLAGIPLGMLNDRLGPRIVLSLCGLLLGLGLLLMSQVNAVWHFYLFYGFVMGIGVSSMVPLTSTVVRWFVKRRTLMSGIVVAGTGMGAIIGPPVADRLIAAYDWRTAYIILGFIVFVVIIVSAQFLRRDPSQKGQVPYGEHLENEQPKSRNDDFKLKEAVTTGQFWLVFGQFICFGFSLFVVMVHIVPHATDLGISSINAAGILALIGAVSIISKIAMGRVGDIIGNKRGFIIGFILVFLSLSWLLFTRELWGFYLFAVIFAVGFGAHIAQHSPAVAGLFGLTAHGSIYGVLGLGMTAGEALGPVVAGYIFDITKDYKIAFLVTIVVCISGLILTALTRTTLSKPTGKLK